MHSPINRSNRKRTSMGGVYMTRGLSGGGKASVKRGWTGDGEFQRLIQITQ